MAKATINAEHYAGCIAKAEFASSFGNGSHKRIMVYAPVDDLSKTMLIVMDHGKIIYEGTDLKAAAEAYNESA